MSRYYIYDSVTDRVAEFAKGGGKQIGETLRNVFTKPSLDKNGFMSRKLRNKTKLGLGGLGVAGVGAAGYGGYKLATRGKKKAEPAPANTSLKSRIKSLVAGAKSKASGVKASAQQGSKAAQKQYNKMTASARKQYSKLRGREEA